MTFVVVVFAIGLGKFKSTDVAQSTAGNTGLTITMCCTFVTSVTISVSSYSNNLLNVHVCIKAVRIIS